VEAIPAGQSDAEFALGYLHEVRNFHRCQYNKQRSYNPAISSTVLDLSRTKDWLKVGIAALRVMVVRKQPTIWVCCCSIETKHRCSQQLLEGFFSYFNDWENPSNHISFALYSANPGTKSGAELIEEVVSILEAGIRLAEVNK